MITHHQPSRSPISFLIFSLYLKKYFETEEIIPSLAKDISSSTTDSELKQAIVNYLGGEKDFEIFGGNISKDAAKSLFEKNTFKKIYW